MVQSVPVGVLGDVDGEVEEEEEEGPVPDIDEGQTSDNQHREESKTLEENLEIKTNVSEHLEEVMINNLVADDDDARVRRLLSAAT